jgi:hypothetical protein
MVIGYVVANGTTTAPADSGVYDMATKQKIKSVTNFQWLSTATAILQMGTLIRYTGSASTKTGTAYLYDVRLDEIDGTELSLDNLLYGTTSQRGGMYKGALSSAPVSGIVPEDFYLNKNDGYIYLYNGSTWAKITDYTDSKYLQAINDMLSISNTSTNNSLITATNAHIENLATRNILANKIATQTINLNNNGLIKSNNFVSGESGFQIDSNGNAEFNSGRFRGGVGTEFILDKKNTTSASPVSTTFTGYFSPQTGSQKIQIYIYNTYSKYYSFLADLDVWYSTGSSTPARKFWGTIFDDGLSVSAETSTPTQIKITYNTKISSPNYSNIEYTLYLHCIKF